MTFKRGALVHFALDQDNVSMTTHLENGRTRFLPFNRGRDGGAGNPDVEGGFIIAYLYRDLPGSKAVWSRDVLLDIIHKFVHRWGSPKSPGARLSARPSGPGFISDAVRRLCADAKQMGAGRNYLFQHSAGSGKSNTIAWVAHPACRPCTTIPGSAHL